MDVILEPRIEKIISLTSNVTNQLKRSEQTNDASAVFGKLCNGDRLTWLVDGSSLIVVHTSNGSIYSVHNFNRNTPIEGHITHVKEFIDDPLKWKLLVVTCNGSKGSFLHVFNIRQSKVDKTIFIPETVTSLEVISFTSGDSGYNILLNPFLRHFQGIVSLGTEGGNVLLLDLGMVCDLDLEAKGNNENLLPPAIKISYFNGKKNELLQIRENLVAENKLVVYLLNGFHSKHTFYYCNPENEIIFDSAAADIYVSTMLYVQQMGCLFVGYSFGGFQIYDLTKLSLVFSCESDDFNDLPVVQFAFQEPENDPKLYCYFWTVRGYTDYSSSCNQFSHASMYSVLFFSKTSINSVGTCYLGVQECVKRFIFPLHGYVKSTNLDNWDSSRLISCIPIDSRTLRKELCSRESASDSFINSSGSICCCVFVWEAYPHDVNKVSKITLGIFDLNQWYQAQMPATLKLSNMELCSYFGFFSLDALNDISSFNLLDVHLPVESMTRPAFFNRVESLFFPSALAFDVVVLTDSAIIRGSYLGLHRQVLQKICANASTLLVDPRQTMDLCLYCSLISQPPNIHFSQMNLPSRKEAIFSMALECNAFGIIMSCINEWAPGRYASDGCTLRFIQDWAWKKVLKIKSYLDKQCTILYDCSGLQIDEIINQSIRQNVVMLKNLEVVYKTLGKQSQIISTTNLGTKELEHRTSVISLLILHYDSVLWFINARLLPELPDVDDSFSGFSYSKSFLSNNYSNRRAEIQRINSSLKPTDLLIIDGIIEETGESIINLWKTQPGNCCYPPSSINALLNIYLLPELCLSVKHTIVQYFLLDINELLQNGSNAQLCEPLTEYSSTFACNHSVMLLTKGFWLLDHKDFDGAMNVLLHPMINQTDIRPWQSRRIMKALLYQGEAGKALRYSHVYQPCKETPEDVQFYLTLLLANGLIPDAFAYLRSVRDMTNSEELIQHFFLGCQQTKNLRGMLQLFYNPMEEQSLIKFMTQNSDPKIRELLVIYHLQRFHFVEALQVNNQLNSDVMHKDPSAKERAVTRNAIIEGYSKVYPNIQLELAKLTRATLSHRKTFWEKGKKMPAPLSTIVVTNGSEPISKSSVLEAVMDKITELWTQTSPRRNSVNETDHLSTCILPQTPFTPRRNIWKETQQSVIHPVIQKRENLDLHFGESFMTSSPVKSKYLDTSPFYLSESSKRRSNSKIFSSELLSILQPVPVKRKLPFQITSTSSVCSSPASILKQRNIITANKELASFNNKEHEFNRSTTLPLVEDHDSLDNLISTPLPHPSNNEEIRTSKIRFSSQKQTVSWPSSTTSSPLIEDVSIESCSPSPRRPLHSSDKFSPAVNTSYNETPNSSTNNSNKVLDENDGSSNDDEDYSTTSESDEQSIYQTPDKVDSSFENREVSNNYLHTAKHTSYFSATGFRERLSWIKTELAKEEVKDSDEITITSNLSTDKTEIKIIDKPVQKSLVEQTVDQCFANETDDCELMKKYQSRKQHSSIVEENSEVDIETIDELVGSSLENVEKNQVAILPELSSLPLPPTSELSVTVEFPGITKASLRSFSPKSSPSSLSRGSKSDRDSICVDKISDLTDSVPITVEAIMEDDITVEVPGSEDSEPQSSSRKSALYYSNSSRKAKKRNNLSNKNTKTYAFSPPTVVEPEISSASLTASALSSPTSAAFLFSTPLTRSRLKKARKSVSSTVRTFEDDCGKSDSSDVPSEGTPHARTRRLSKSSDGTPSSSDTLINFTSPALEAVPEESESSLLNVRHSMTLRKSKMKSKRLTKFR